MNYFNLIEKHKKGIFFVAAVLGLGGIFAALRLPISLFPDIVFPRIVILSDNGEAPADRMMIEVTRPLEEAAKTLPGVTLVRSATSRGSSQISVNFEWGTDIIQSLQLLQGKIASIRNQLPSTVSVDIEAMNVTVFPVEGFSLSSDRRSAVELRDLASYLIRPALVSIPGVLDVKVVGGKTREFLIQIDPARLLAHKLSADEVADAIQKTNLVGATGLVERNYQIYLSLVEGLFQTLDDINNAVVAVQNGVPVKVSDVAKVTPAEKIEYIRVTAEGEPAVLVNIMRQPKGNTVQIGKDVRTQLEQLKRLIPPDVRIKYFYDQADFISSSISSLRDSISVGILLAIIILFVFLRSFRISMVAVIAVPAIMAATLLVLYACGQTLNIMTLGGMAAAVGLILDDMVVLIENIFTQLRARHETMAQAVGTSLKELMPAIIGSSLSTIVVFIPFAFLGGVAGAFFKSLAITMASALSVSLLYSVTLVPILSKIFITRRDVEAETRREKASGHLVWAGYEKALRFCMRWKKIAPLGVLVVFGATYLLYRQVGSGFMPDMDEGSFVLDYWSPPGTSLDETDRMLREVENILQATPEVESHSRRTGTQMGFFITEPNSGDLLVKLKPGRRRSVFEIIDDLRVKIEATEPALRVEFLQAMQDLIGDLAYTPAPIEIKIFGDKTDVVEAKAREVAALIEKVPGVVDVFDGIVISGPAIVIKPDPALSMRAGLTPQDLLSQLETIMRGRVDSYVLRGERLIGIRVRYPDDYHAALDVIQNTLLKSPGGFFVPLRTLASVEILKGQSQIDRENLKLMLPVTARISGRDLGGTVADIQTLLKAKLVLPPGVWYDFGGLYQGQRESFLGLLMVLVAAVLLVFTVVLFEFGSFAVPLSIFSVNLAALFGVVAALLLTGVSFNISSFVGAIMMVGIVSENAVFLLHSSRKFEAGGMSVPEALIAACKLRARPILMTMLAAVFALTPLALGIGAGAQMQQPLAIAIIGGFSVSSFLLLFLLPMIYAFFRRAS